MKANIYIDEVSAKCSDNAQISLLPTRNLDSDPAAKASDCDTDMPRGEGGADWVEREKEQMDRRVA